MDKRKLPTVLQVLSEVYATFLDTQEFIDKKLEKICSKEKLYVGEVIYFLLLRLIADGFIEKKLEEIYSREKLDVEEVVYFSLFCLIADGSLCFFFCGVLFTFFMVCCVFVAFNINTSYFLKLYYYLWFAMQ